MNISSINGGAPLKPGDVVTVIGTDLGSEGGTVFLIGECDQGNIQIALASTLGTEDATWTDTQVQFTMRSVRDYVGVYTGGINSPFTALGIRLTRLENGEDGTSDDMAATFNPPAGHAVVDMPYGWTYGPDQLLSHTVGIYTPNVGVGQVVQVIHETVTEDANAVTIGTDGIISVAGGSGSDEFWFSYQTSALDPDPIWFPATELPRATPLRSGSVMLDLNRYVPQNYQRGGLLRGQIINQLRARLVK